MYSNHGQPDNYSSRNSTNETRPKRTSTGPGHRVAVADVLDALALGLAVLPLCNPMHVGVGRSHARTCTHPGKRPFFPTRPGDGRWDEFKPARTGPGRVATEDEIRRWWRLDPGLNLGVALGAVGGARLPVVAVDVDHALGHAKLLEVSGGDLPPTWEYDTGRDDGYRLVYRLLPGRTAATVPYPDPATQKEHLKLMAAGTQVVWPPSIHPTGRGYRWRPGRSPADLPLAPLPAWWPADRRLATGLAVAGGGRGVLFAEPGRNSALTAIAGAARRKGAGPDALFALLTTVNATQCDPPLEDDEVRRIVASISRYAPAPRPKSVLTPATRTVFTPGEGRHG